MRPENALELAMWGGWDPGKCSFEDWWGTEAMMAPAEEQNERREVSRSSCREGSIDGAGKLGAARDQGRDFACFFCFSLFFFKVYLFILKERAGEGQREGHKRESQAGSMLSAWSPTWGLNLWTVRS